MIILSGKPLEISPYGRKLMQIHPKHHFSSQKIDLNGTISTLETESGRDFFRSFNNIRIPENNSVS